MPDLPRGAILFAPVMYSDGESSKPRPVCVVSVPGFNAGPDVLLAMVTSSTRTRQHPGIGDVVVENWETAGLWRPSVVRTGRLFALEHRHLGRRLGDLSAHDLHAVNRGFIRVLGLGLGDDVEI